MKKVKLHADLLIKSDQHQISVSNKDSSLEIDIIGKSALSIPFKGLKKLYKLKDKTRNIEQKILIKKNSKDLFHIYQGQLKIHSYSTAFSIFIKSLFA